MNIFFKILRRLAERGEIAVVIAAILIITFGAFLSIREGNRVKSLDEISFYDIGQNLATHLQFAHTDTKDGPLHDPTILGSGLRSTAYRAPGYVFFIAPFMFLGAEYPALRFANFVVMAVTLTMLYYLLVTRYSRLAGLLSVFFVLAYPVLLYTASTLYPQTLESFLLLVTVFLLDRTGRTANLWTYAFVGIAYGALILTIPIVLLLAPIVLLWMLLCQRSRFSQIALTAVVMICCVGLWTVRNYFAFHTLVPMTTNGGRMLFEGNRETFTYDQPLAPFPDYVGAEITGKSEVESDRVFARFALEYMRKYPGRTLTSYLQKFFYWFAYSNKLASDIIIPGGASGVQMWVRDIVMMFTYIPLLVILIARLCCARRFPLSVLEWLFLALYLGGGMAYAIFYTRIRYRLPFDWLLIAVDAIFVAHLINARSALRESSSPGPVDSAGP